MIRVGGPPNIASVINFLDLERDSNSATPSYTASARQRRAGKPRSAHPTSPFALPL